MRRPGIEPGPRAWKARILTIELSTQNLLTPTAGIEPATTWLRVMRSTIWAKRAHNDSVRITSLTGFEPAIFPLGEGCVIHCATETYYIVRVCTYVQKLLLLSYHMPSPGIEPGTFRSSVWRSPSWAIKASLLALICKIKIIFYVSRTGIEPVSAGWEPAILTN